MSIFNISTVKAALSAGMGVARSNRYLVYIYSPFDRITPITFSALIDKAEFPGKSFMTTKRHTYGPVRNVPYLTSFEDMTINIICTSIMKERVFFDDWQNKICNINSGYFSYYDDYVGEVFVVQLTEDGIPTYSIKLEEAYPVIVSPQPVSYGGESGALVLGVTFKYHKWRNSYQLFDRSGSGADGRSLYSEVEVPSPTLEEIGGKVDSGVYLPENSTILNNQNLNEALDTVKSKIDKIFKIFD